MTTSSENRRVRWSNEIEGNPLGTAKKFKKTKKVKTIEGLKEVNVFATNI